ncbi:neutral zinc metallopeptidase [Chryseobacterium sp. CT-SW4]|uniref:metalloprotease n=1 Tax=Chryseobacterium sp. SW-1 TaxID=3157343 RepID=UPI003B02D09A
MKKNYRPYVMVLGAMAVLSLTACNSDSDLTESSSLTLSGNESRKNEEFEKLQKICSYVDQNWSQSAVLRNNLANSTDTNFMYSQMTRIANLWGKNSPVLKFVDDPYYPNSTLNAYSYPGGRIYFGYALYYDAKNKGGNIVNAMILAHEFGHQLQFLYDLPTYVENTARSMELEADGFAGYYLRRPEGYNKTNFSEIANAYEYARQIGDYNTTSSNHHGTPAQRRSAVRLGFLLGQYSLNANEFDDWFFYYYQGVLNGTHKGNKKINNPELEAYMNQYTDELKQIQKGEISAEEFKNLK